MLAEGRSFLTSKTFSSGGLNFSGIWRSPKRSRCAGHFTNHPVCAAKDASRHLFDGAATPPLKGGEWGRLGTNPIPLLFRGCCKTSELLVGAVKEAVNECEASNSPPDIGGVAAPSRKRCEATAAAQTGWLGVPKCFGMPSKEASRLLL